MSPDRIFQGKTGRGRHETRASARPRGRECVTQLDCRVRTPVIKSSFLITMVYIKLTQMGQACSRIDLEIQSLSVQRGTLFDQRHPPVEENGNAAASTGKRSHQRAAPEDGALLDGRLQTDGIDGDTPDDCARTTPFLAGERAPKRRGHQSGGHEWPGVLGRLDALTSATLSGVVAGGFGLCSITTVARRLTASTLMCS